MSVENSISRHRRFGGVRLFAFYYEIYHHVFRHIKFALIWDHVLSFSRLHGNDSGGSVGLRFSDFLRLFLFFLFIHSFIYLFILFHFILFYFLFILCYFMLFYFIFIHLFFHPNDPPEIGKRIRR